MANTFAPFGFQEYFGGSGQAPTFAQTVRKIASTNTVAIFSGDPINPVIAANGYITQGVPGTVRIDGVFMGCTYSSTSQKRRVWGNYWPGSDATGDVAAYISDNPNAQFVVQGFSTNFNITGTLSTNTSTPVGQYAQYAIGTGNAANGRSGAFLNSIGTTVTLPFIVTGFVTEPPGANGADPAGTQDGREPVRTADGRANPDA